MNCPTCNKPQSKVIDSRYRQQSNSIRRRRECPKCKKRWTTVEFRVVKMSEGCEDLERAKIVQDIARDVTDKVMQLRNLFPETKVFNNLRHLMEGRER